MIYICTDASVTVHTKNETIYKCFTVRVVSNLGNTKRINILVQGTCTLFCNFVPWTEQNQLCLR